MRGPVRCCWQAPPAGLPVGSVRRWPATGLLTLTSWLVRHDIACGQCAGRAGALHGRLHAGGYAWLGLAGLALIAQPPSETALGHDIALHTVLIGFVLSMVFGHAPIILPAVARLRVPYGPLLYGPLVLLHASVTLRAGSGSPAGIPADSGAGC